MDFPVILATKEMVNARFCIEFRKLNANMHRDKCSALSVEEIFDNLRSRNIITTFALVQSYWQVKMNETRKEKMNIICEFSTCQFEVIPFG